MSLETVRSVLEPAGRDVDVLTFTTSSATVELAAEALGVDPARIAKTLSLYSADGERALLVVVAGDVKLASGPFKRAFGHKARMLAAPDVERLTGHPVGGVCPFANPDGAEVWLDGSLRRFDTVFPAAGSASSAIELTLPDLERLSGAAGWVDVTRQPDHGGPERSAPSMKEI
ncbi:MAG: YbaK/EbsC family protein [Cellulomonadaceae bacterium]